MTNKNKKNDKLGMNYSTASARLIKDLMFKFIVETNRDTCYRCNQKLSRETFSIDHKEAWLNSEDPVQLFFDLENISFSHLKCNIAASERPNKGVSKYESRQEAWRVNRKKNYDPEKRKLKYQTKGY